MPGSLRQRGPDSWQLCVYLGVDADTGRERWAAKTVHGSRRHASSQLAAFVEEAGYARLRAGTVADLLDLWLVHASPTWSTSTLRQNRSVIECHLKPLLGHVAVNKLTTVDIDDVYRHLFAPVEPRVSHWRRARCTVCTSCCIGRSPRPCVGSGRG